MSLNRTLANLINTDGDVKAASLDLAASITVVEALDSLPTSSLTAGDQAYVKGTSRFYVSNGSGWYNAALVNATPSLSISPTGTIELNTDGSTTTITLTATDSDYPDAALTYSVESDGSFFGLATLSQDSSVFTITPLSEDSATTTSAVLTFKASDQVSFGSGTRTLALSFKVENSNYTTLLLKADSDGTDNQVDASSSARAITENGDITSTAFSPYHPGGYSTYFDGSGDYIQAAYSSGFDLNSDFTVEAWIYPLALSGNHLVIDTYEGGVSGSFQLYYRGTGNSLAFYTEADMVILQDPSSSTIAVNNWYHIAVTRSGTTCKMFINGTEVDSVTNSRNLTHSNNIVIGRQNATGTNYWNGYIRDVRVIKGTAVYTSNFTSPTAPLTAISGTSLLTCHLPYIADGSTNGHSITVNGNTSTKRFGPYDYLGYAKTNHGGSVYFDGTNDNLSMASSADFNFGSSDWTIEAWLYQTARDASNICRWYMSGTNGDTNAIHISINTNGTLDCGRAVGGGVITGTSTATVPLNTWNHVVATKEGSNGYLYLNGKQVATSGSATEQTSGDISLRIGYDTFNTVNEQFTGYMSDLQIIKGTRKYTAEFTPPTSPISAHANSVLLTCTNKNDIWDAGFGARMVKGGNTTASGTEAKFTTEGRGAIYFDGTSDYLDIYPASTLYALGSKDFTIDMWVNFTVASSDTSYRRFFMADDGGNIANNFQILVDVGGVYGSTGAVLVFAQNGSNVNSDIRSTTAINDGNWHHIAVSRTSNTVRLFVDGIRQGTNLTSWTHGFTTAVIPRLGSDATTTSGNYQGYIQDFRLLVGKSLYTTDSSITVPTAEFSG